MNREWTISRPANDAEFAACYDLRWRVLRQPWNQPRGSERDELESRSVHVMACDEGRVVGVGRLHFNNADEAQIRFMAVEAECEGQGIGSLILGELEREAVARGARRIVLNARETVVGFYRRHGYRLAGDGPTLFGAVRHLRMIKEC